MRSNALGALMKLRCTGTVEEYQAKFLPLLACYQSITQQQQIDIFKAGLRKSSTD
jgi:hypothetical protein